MLTKALSPYTSKTKTPFPVQQAVGIWHYILRQIMPCIIFSVHLRQQAAHYLHSTQISGLVSAGISFRSEWLCLLSKGRACHTHLLKGVTLKRACVHVVPLYTLLFIWVFDACKNKSWCTKVMESQWEKKNLNSVTYRFYYFLTWAATNKSKSFSIFLSCQCYLLLSHCLEARCVMLLLKNDFREAAHP